MAEQTVSTNIKQPEENKSGFDLSEAGNANKSNEEPGKVDGRYFADLDKAILDEERHKAELEFEPLPSFLLGEEEKTLVTCRPVFTLFINNLPDGVNDNGVANVFREYGDIIASEIICRRRESTNFAKVSFRTRQEAVSAIRNVHKQPPLYLNVVFERRQEARDWKNKKDEERVKFGDEWLEKWRNFENTKEKIVKEYEDKFGQETVEPSNEVDCNKMDHDNGIPPKSGVKEKFELSCQSKGFEMNTKDTVAVEASNNFKGKKKSVPSGDEVDSVTGNSNSSADSTATFGHELFVPYLAPCPCLECRQPGRMLCSRCQAWYCSLTCQVNNWPKHKDLCSSVHAQGGITLLGEGRKSNKNQDLCKSNKHGSNNVSLDRKWGKSSVRAKGHVSSGSQVDQTRSSQDNCKLSKKAAFGTMQSSSTQETEKDKIVGTANTPDDDKIIDIIEPVVGNVSRITAAEPAVHIQETIVPRNQWTEILQPISAIESPHKFWVQPKFNEKLLKKLGEGLEQHVATAADIVDASEGAFRLVEIGGCWHRAQVIRVDPDSQEALVRLVDMGGDIEVKCSSLLRLPHHLASTPALVVQVAMAGVKPPHGDRWTKEDEEKFKFFLCADLSDETRMWIKPVGFSEGTLLVSMKDHENNDLDELCIEFGLARKVNQVENVMEIPAIEAIQTELQLMKTILCSSVTEDNPMFAVALQKIRSRRNTSTRDDILDSEEEPLLNQEEETTDYEVIKTEDNKVVGVIQTEDNKVVKTVQTEDNTVVEAVQTENKNISSSGEDDKMELFKPQFKQNPNWKTTGHAMEIPSVNNSNISTRGESEAMEISKQDSGKNSDGIVSEYFEEIPLSSRKVDDSFSTNSHTPKSIIDQLKVGHVYEFVRAEGHPLSEFGAMCHFDCATFDYIYNDMQREYNGTAQDLGPDNPPSPGDMVVAYCADKSTFYRAVVLNLPTQDDAEVLLVDVGGTEVVRFCHLRVMAGRANNPDEFPFLAVRFFSLDSLSPQAEATMTMDPGGKIRVQVESVEEGAAVVGVLDKANTVVAKYKVDAWLYLHPRIGHLFPTEMNGAFPKTMSRHQAVFVSQLKPVKIVDGDTVILRNIGKFACFGMIQLTETEPTFRALKQALAVCEKLPRVDFPPLVGQILVVQKAAGRKMMRAEVVKVDEPGRKATVRCLDYPDLLALPWSNMTLIPDTALSIPTQCRQMRLAGVPQIPRKPAMSLLHPIAASLERPLRLEYHHEDQSMPCVYLYESNRKRINELIISTLAQSNTGEIQDSLLKISTSAKAKLKEKVSSTNLPLEYDPANCLSFQVGEDKEVFILSAKDKSNLVHVCSVDVLEQLESLQERLQTIGSNSLTTNSVSSVAVNKVYLAQSADGNWYRAVVLKTKHQKCVAYFPDFGFKEKIPFEKIQDFHEEFYRYAKAVPFFASACVVNNMKDENGNRLDISKNSTHTIRVRRKEAELHFIDVLNLKTDKEVI